MTFLVLRLLNVQFLTILWRWSECNLTYLWRYSYFYGEVTAFKISLFDFFFFTLFYDRKRIFRH